MISNNLLYKNPTVIYTLYNQEIDLNTCDPFWVHSRGKNIHINHLGLLFPRKGKPLPIEMNRVAVCCNWILSFVEPSRMISGKHSSYGLKHIVERYDGDYIGNGEFIYAAILLGYRFEQFGPNALFNMNFKKWECFLKGKKYNPSSHERLLPYMNLRLMGCPACGGNLNETVLPWVVFSCETCGRDYTMRSKDGVIA